MNWKEEFSEKIGCVNVSDLKIEEAQSLKLKNMPEFLYKYRPASTYAINNLETDTVWLNQPSEYNDPFEFVEYLNFEKLNISITNQMKDEIIEGMIKKHPVPDEIIAEARKSNYPIRVISEYQFKHYENKTDSEIEEINRISDEILKKMIVDRNVEKIKNIQDKMKVCSFCESPKQLLMWSHYADCHKGFCVEYNIRKWAPMDIRNRIMYPVVYKKDFFDFTNHLISQVESNNFNNLYPIISGTTKSSEWKYEQEWRLIFAIGDSFPTQNYPMNCQTKVYIGSRMCEDKKKRIIEICRLKGLEVYNALPSTEKYEMTFEKIK